MGGVWRNGFGARELMASAVARAYNEGVGFWGSGAKPPEAESFFKYRMSKIRHKITSFQCFRR